MLLPSETAGADNRLIRDRTSRKATAAIVAIAVTAATAEAAVRKISSRPLNRVIAVRDRLR